MHSHLRWDPTASQSGPLDGMWRAWLVSRDHELPMLITRRTSTPPRQYIVAHKTFARHCSRTAAMSCERMRPSLGSARARLENRRSRKPHAPLITWRSTLGACLELPGTAHNTSSPIGIIFQTNEPLQDTVLPATSLKPCRISSCSLNCTNPLGNEPGADLRHQA